VASNNWPAIGLWKKLSFLIVGTLTKAFRHKPLGYIDAYVIYQLLQDSDHWPTADEAGVGGGCYGCFYRHLVAAIRPPPSE